MVELKEVKEHLLKSHIIIKIERCIRINHLKNDMVKMILGIDEKEFSRLTGRKFHDIPLDRLMHYLKILERYKSWGRSGFDVDNNI